MRRNVASQLISAQMVSATDGSDVTGGTTAVAVEIDGVAGTGGNATHIANGKWEYAPIQADTDGAYLTFQFTQAGAITQTVQIYTIDAISTDVWAEGARTLTAANNITSDNSAINVTSGTVDAVTTTATATNVAQLGGQTITAAAGITFNAEVGASATAMDNFQLMYDGTGYTDATAPASRAQVDNIGAGSGGTINIEATQDNTGGAIIDSVLHVGSVQGATTFANTEAEDGVLHDIDATANDIDIVYGFDIGGGRTASEVTFAGFCQGITDEIKMKVYDHVGADWEIIGTVAGQTGTDNISIVAPLLLKHTGTTTELGKVYIRFDTDSTTPSNLSVDKLLVSAINVGTSVGYAEGAIWVDGTNGVSGVEAFVNGVADNPVQSWADALTLSASVGVTRFHIAAGTTITLTGSSDNYEFLGSGYNLALNGQSIDGMYCTGATVTGNGEATVTAPTFENCKIGSVQMPPALLKNCGIGDSSGTFAVPVDSGDWIFERCYSLVPGSGSPTFNFTNQNGTSGINNRFWSGGATYTLDSGCTLSHEVLVGGGTTITTGGADVEVRGVMRSLTVTMAAAETVQFAGVTGIITLSGTTTGTVNLYGVSSSVADSTSGATVTDSTVSAAVLTETRLAELDAANLPTDVDAIKTATDKLTFTDGTNVDSNVQKINDVTIVGDGSATPFNV